MKSVVITGASGFLGSHLTKYLSENDTLVYAIGRHFNDELPNNNIKYICCNSLNYPWLIDSLPANPDAFIHLAWSGVSPESRNDESTQSANISLAEDALKLASSLRSKMFILPGSTMEYAYSGQIINRHTVPSPKNEYGKYKILVKQECEQRCKEHSIPFIYVVITGIYSEDRKDNNVIYYSISELLKGYRPSLTELKQKWDYIHIDDVCRAFNNIVTNGKGGAFYALGHGDNQPLADYIYTIRDIIDPNLPLGIGDIPYENDIIPQSCVDLTELQSDTGYVPEISFDEGIKKVIEAVKKEMAI